MIQSNLSRFLSPNGLAIFLFHGVIERQFYSVRNYNKKHIEKDVFYKYMDNLKSCGYPLSMDEVLCHLEKKVDFPPNAFAINFDDGFENNFSCAGSILEEFQIPAMIYLTTDFIDNNGMSWIDQIESAVEVYQGDSVELLWAQKRFLLDTVSNKINFLESVRSYVKNNPSCNPYNFADEICRFLNLNQGKSSNDPLDKKLTWEQIKAIHSTNSLLSFGGHGKTHSILSFLSVSELRKELDICFMRMKEKANLDSIHFSYPEGLSHCFSEEVIDELKFRGVRCSPTAIHGINTIYSNPFKLNRITVV